jgi:hypothetical protein
MAAERGYFVRIAPTLGTPTTSADPRASIGGATTPRRRHRHRLHVPVGFVVLLALGGWLAWAQTREGGARAQIQHAIDNARGAVENATTDPGMKRAATYFNEQYARDGRYVQWTEAQQRADPNVDWGVGVAVNFCNPQALVLHSLAGSGTVSRLLLRGHDLGDAVGKHACPVDYANPVPWNVP